MTEKQLYELQGKNVKFEFADKTILQGKCTYFTKAIDNDPEIASISLATADGVFEITLDEIKKATIE